MTTKLETLIAELSNAAFRYGSSCTNPARMAADEFALDVAKQNLRDALRQQADQQAQPVAWLKEWADVSYPDDYDHRRVDLTPDCEAWLQAKNPKITPLFTSPPAQPQAEGMALVPVRLLRYLVDAVMGRIMLDVIERDAKLKELGKLIAASQKENNYG